MGPEYVIIFLPTLLSSGLTMFSRKVGHELLYEAYEARDWQQLQQKCVLVIHP